MENYSLFHDDDYERGDVSADVYYYIVEVEYDLPKVGRKIDFVWTVSLCSENAASHIAAMYRRYGYQNVMIISVKQDSEQKDLGKDRTDTECENCHKGTYVETSLQDDMHGVLHCNACRHEVRRWTGMD